MFPVIELFFIVNLLELVWLIKYQGIFLTGFRDDQLNHALQIVL